MKIAVTELKTSNIQDWEVTLDSATGYLRISHQDHPGEIHLKATDEGFIVDIVATDDEVVASTAAHDHDLWGWL